MTDKRVVIIGAGVVGAALADELGQLGWSDVTVLEKGDLPMPGGSSSHAPGLLFQTNASRAMSKMAQYTADKFKSLSYENAPCFLPVGGLEIATTPERLAELHRRQGYAAACGVAARMVSAEECLEIQPLLNADIVLGGLHTPTDGIAKAVRAVNAQLERAREHGVRVLERHEVLDIRTAGGKVTGVVTDRGEFDADYVVCCAGIWGQKIASMVGLNLPILPLAHCDAISEPLPSLAGASAEAKGPLIRHGDGGVYYRERFDRLDIGSFEHRPIPVHYSELLPVDEAEVMPSQLPFTPEDFEGAWKETNRLFPETANISIAQGMNGVFAFTADDFPLIGQAPEVEGFWVAEAVWVTHSAGVAKAVAECLTHGYSSSFDLHECDLNRFEAHELDDSYVLDRAGQNYLDVYAIKHPLQPIESPRNLRVSAFYPRERALGAEFVPVHGWEQPLWYGSNETLLKRLQVRERNAWAARYWSPIVAAEAKATRENVALFDMTPLTRLEVSGTGATAFLDRLTTKSVDRPVGSVTYCLMLDEGGRVRSDITVARLGENKYQVGANGQLDLDWMHRHVGDGEAVVIRDVTGGTCCVGVWGPNSRSLISRLTDLKLDSEHFPYFQVRQAFIAGIPVTAVRLSYVGELGWELYTTADFGLRLWDALWAAGEELGVIAAGRGAFTSLRLEKGYRSFGQDMTFEHDPFEAGLGFAVNLKSNREFVGRKAVEKRREAAERKLVPLVLTESGAVVAGREPVLDGDAAIGYVTSAAYGYTIDAGIAYAWVPDHLSAPGTELAIGYFGDRIPAKVAAEPLYDPDMLRLRS
ncbi:FAD-dependent oxidoreductase [Arthrobacter sp. GCM10027362]|uniref:GcvT family protein n=1 Tax=Arthrobacter sp. GCM10027362 TaxID=3273379 RepID=UPI00362C2EAB